MSVANRPKELFIPKTCCSDCYHFRGSEISEPIDSSASPKTTPSILLLRSPNPITDQYRPVPAHDCSLHKSTAKRCRRYRNRRPPSYAQIYLKCLVLKLSVEASVVHQPLRPHLPLPKALRNVPALRRAARALLFTTAPVAKGRRAEDFIPTPMNGFALQYSTSFLRAPSLSCYTEKDHIVFMRRAVSCIACFISKTFSYKRSSQLKTLDEKALDSTNERSS